MENQERRDDLFAAKPFLLRPSALGTSGGGFGSSLSQQNQSSLLRPSKLTAIADQIENSSLDILEEEKDEGEIVSKKQKSDDSKSSNSKHLELNEQLVQPQGIGTFGFAKGESQENEKVSNSNQPVESSSSSSKSIFGQNIHERVVGFQEIKKQSQHNDPEEDSSATSKGESACEEDQENKLAQNASDHMKKEESSKLHLREVEILTGEEGERNVLQIQCKLHMFNKDKTTWVEKGRGYLKLNDICQSEMDGIFQSRIVFRTNGSHLVVLNTLLWPEMCYEKASSKNLRFTAIHHDTKQVKIYLISATQKDILQLYTAIDRRVLALKRSQVDTKVSERSESEAAKNDNEADTIDPPVYQSTEESTTSEQGSELENNNSDAKDSNFDSDSNNSNESFGNET
eukprot:gene8040-8903_t